MDLTKIEKPFGLLDAETQAALRAHGGPYEIFFWSIDGKAGWNTYSGARFDFHTTYRVKPAPPKPREWWLTSNGCSWETYEEAFSAYDDPDEIIHVREVL